MKVGDNIVCKNFCKNHNGTQIYEDPNITINKSYKLLEIVEYNHSVSTGLKMLTIIGNNDKICYYWNDYFYSKKQLRKLKLDKLKK